MDNIDYMESLISQSCHLETEWYEKKAAGCDPKELQRIREESDILWNIAKEIGKDGVTRKNYEDLINGILSQAVFDYEMMLSGTTDVLAPASIMGNEKTIELFLKTQTYTQLDMGAQIDKIKKIYYNEFIPLAEENCDEIKALWKKKKYKYHCPMCGGMIRPCHRSGQYGIGCTGCNLFRNIRKWEVA